jgi:hypothetical protein
MYEVPIETTKNFMNGKDEVAKIVIPVMTRIN